MWPEFCISLIALIFMLRELGTFPASWADEGLFVIVAKMLAGGQGYAMPLLQGKWLYPYFLNVGPTLIVPVAASIRIFGVSLVAARIPMVLWMIACTALFYIFTRRVAGRINALWATALLVTLSAFVNTGKPVLGEIPAFTFLIGGLLILMQGPSWKRTVVSGLLFGLAFLTKITFGLILPALGVAWLRALVRKRWTELRDVTVIGILTILVFLPWRIVEMTHTIGSEGLAQQLKNFLAGGDGSTLMYVLRFTPELLLRLPYLAFGLFFLFAVTGWWALRKRLNATTWIVIGTLVALVMLYFVNGFGWYRLLLPAHLLLLPFVPTGAFTLLGKRAGTVVLILIIAAQAHWQWTHRGSNPSLEGPQAVAYIIGHYQEKNLIVEQTEIFGQLPFNPRWRFIMPNISFSLSPEFSTVAGDDCRIPLLRKLSEEQRSGYRPQQIEVAAGRYVIVHDYPCPYTVQ